jgi:uncharacterized metal-binding protein
MTPPPAPSKVLVIPCSGIGKVHGLLSRECAYLVADELAPETTEIVCLALLVREDAETLALVRARASLAIDGCVKACAQKNIEIAGGTVARAFQVGRALTAHRGAQPGDGSNLTDQGWAICREVAGEVAQEAARICASKAVA